MHLKKFQPSQKQMAEEIHGVILAVSNFQLWADEMREIRRNEMEQLLLDKKYIYTVQIYLHKKKFKNYVRTI